jgi:uncharacterized protein
MLVLATVIYPLVLWGAWQAWENSHTRVLDWLPEKFAETRELFEFVRRFGADDMVVVGWESANLQNEQVIQMADRLRGVDTAGGATQPYFDQVLSGPDIFAALTGPPLNLTDRQARMRMNGWMLGAGDRTAVMARPSEFGLADRHRSVRFVRQVAGDVTGLAEAEIHIAGPTVDSVYIDELNKQSLLQLNGLSLSVCLLVLLACVRRILPAVVIFSIAIYMQQLAMAVIHYTGGHMDSVVMMTANLTMVLSVSASVHLYGYYHGLPRDTERRAYKAFREAFTPTALAAITTGIGLFSLLVSDLTPIFSFGLYGALVAPLATFLSLAYLALFLSLFDDDLQGSGLQQNKAQGSGVAGGQAASTALTTTAFATTGMTPPAGKVTLAMRWWPALFIAAAVLLIVGGRGLKHLQANVGLHNLLDSDSKLLGDYRWLEQHIGPIVPIEVVLEIPQIDGHTLVQELASVATLQQRLTANAAVGQTISALNFLPPLGPWSRQHSVGEIARQRVLERRIEESLGELESWRLFYREGSRHYWRVTAKVSGSVGQDYERLVDELIEEGRCAKQEMALQGTTVSVSGGVPVAMQTQRRLLIDLGYSFLLAAALIYGALTLMLKSPLAGALALVPNLLPAVAVFGTMGLCGYKVEIGGAMTASVVLGIAIDDALHLLHQFRVYSSAGLDRASAAVAAYERCRRAILQTSLIIGAGMAVFALSDFVPISRFAWLMVLVLGSALVANLVLLPSMLYSPLGELFRKRLGAGKA